MNALWTAIGVMLGVAALLGMIRMLMGPSVLDRALSVDVLIASALTGTGAYAAFHRDPTVLPTLLVLSLLGFIGSVSIAKFVARRTLQERSSTTTSVHPVSTATDPHPAPAAPTDTAPEPEKGENP